MITMKVKIKTWEQMEEEFGLDRDGDIAITPCFSQRMEELMPVDRIIEVTPGFDGVYLWETKWHITNDMIEEFIEGRKELNFKEWLKEQGAAPERYRELGSTMTSEDPPEDWLDATFVWSDTVEGVTYWSNLNDKWCDAVAYARSSGIPIVFGFDDPATNKQHQEEQKESKMVTESNTNDNHKELTRRELYRKHKDALLHWLDGGNVWFRVAGDPKDTWCLNSDPHFVEGYIYVPDDEYAELRKAWYDGEQIQVKSNGRWISVSKPDWVLPPEDYRIKPKEWYDHLDGTMEKAILCWVWDDDDATKYMEIVVSKDDEGFWIKEDILFNYAEPAKMEELKQYIWNPEEDQ